MSDWADKLVDALWGQVDMMNATPAERAQYLREHTIPRKPDPPPDTKCKGHRHLWQQAMTVYHDPCHICEAPDAKATEGEVP